MIGVITIMSSFFGSKHVVKEVNEEKYFPLEEINEIQVDMTCESVHIIGTEENKEVKLHYHGTPMQEIELTPEINNNTLTVRAQSKSRIPRIGRIFLDVYIPKEYTKDLFIKTSLGSVRVDSVGLRCFTTAMKAGKLEIEKLNAEKVSINMSTGNVSLKNSSGEFAVKVGTGKVEVDCKEFEDQNINIETSSGSITLKLPGAAEFLIEARISTRKFHSDFPITMAKDADKSKIKGQAGMKTNKVLLRTSTGSIEILKN